MRQHELRILPDLVSNKQQVDVQGSRPFGFDALPPELALKIQGQGKQRRRRPFGEGEGHRVPILRLGQSTYRLTSIEGSHS